MDARAVREKPRTIVSTVGNSRIREAAATSKNKLKDIRFVCPRRSASRPLGTENTSEKTLGIDTMTLAMRMDNPYSPMRIGRRARGRFVKT